MGAALPATRQKAVAAIEAHIIDVKLGRVRLGLSPQEVDRYVSAEYKRLKIVKYCG